MQADSYEVLLAVQYAGWSTTDPVALLADARRHRMKLLQVSHCHQCNDAELNMQLASDDFKF